MKQIIINKVLSELSKEKEARKKEIEIETNNGEKVIIRDFNFNESDDTDEFKEF